MLMVNSSMQNIDFRTKYRVRQYFVRLLDK